MRKLAAIFMLSVFTFNIAGYQLLYNYMASRSDQALEVALDANRFNESELITIKQPTNLPYYTNNARFQRIDGEVEMNGVTYKYVQCRIYNDSLEMRCIPNKGKMQLEQSRNEYAKVAHDFQQPTDKKKAGNEGHASQKTQHEYEEQLLPQIGCSSILLTTRYVLVKSVPEKTAFLTTVEQPPETVA